MAVACFLLANIFLGIIGTFWFRTEYRKGEMGLRMALGSTRRQLNSIMVGEGVLLLVLAFIPSLLISFNIAHMDLSRRRLCITSDQGSVACFRECPITSQMFVIGHFFMICLLIYSCLRLWHSIC